MAWTSQNFSLCGSGCASLLSDAADMVAFQLLSASVYAVRLKRRSATVLCPSALSGQENIPPQPALAMQSPSPPAHFRRRHHQQPHCNTRSRRRRLEAEAVESAAGDDPSSECIESESDAQDLYRSAIRGVRNARQARQQIRSATQHCPVCAKFAAFIAHFI